MKPKFDPNKPAVCVRGNKRFPARSVGVVPYGAAPLVYMVDYGGGEVARYYYESGNGSFLDDGYLINIPEKRVVWRYTVVCPVTGIVHTGYWSTEGLARESCAKWEKVEGVAILEPPHPFEYEVPE